MLTCREECVLVRGEQGLLSRFVSLMLVHTISFVLSLQTVVGQ